MIDESATETVLDAGALSDLRRPKTGGARTELAVDGGDVSGGSVGKAVASAADKTGPPVEAASEIDLRGRKSAT